MGALFLAHTATVPDGGAIARYAAFPGEFLTAAEFSWRAGRPPRPEDLAPDQSPAWQTMAQHAANVAGAAADFGAAFGGQRSAALAGWLHDLGKYARGFQRRLCDPSVRGLNHWSAGAAVAFQRKDGLATMAIEGHHTGLPDCGDFNQTVGKMGDPDARAELTGCAESLEEKFTFWSETDRQADFEAMEETIESFWVKIT